MTRSASRSTRGCAVALLLGGVAGAQDLEPRRWTHLPVDTNFVALAYAFTKGDVAFDPVLRIDQVDVELHTAVAGYTRYFPLLGTTARVDVLVPYQIGEWEGRIDGVATEVSRDGFADPIVRLSANLTGAPALRGRDWVEWKQQNPDGTAAGVALEARLPLGEYLEDRLINLGQNRFAIAPQAGVLHTSGLWSFELTGTTVFYTDNDEFFGGSRLEQDPLFAVQGHVVRTFAGGTWLSAGIAYGWGGQSSVDGEPKDDEKGNLLYGASFGFRIDEAQGVKIGYIRGDTRVDAGSDTHSVAVAWSFRF